MKRDRIVSILLKVNIARRISDHLLGDEHPLKHRMMVGAILMVVGGGIAESTIFSYIVIKFLFNIIGYGIHGAGLIPFIDWLTQKKMAAEKHERLEHKVVHPTQLRKEEQHG